MWLSFWRSRNRFSLEELRYLIDQLQKVQIVNEVNKDFVVEALRSIAELMTYGDQHDSSFFEFFMEKQVMGELVRVLKISRTISVSLQLLQTMSIMIQNLKNEHAIYYLFSNEHMNYLITYSFDFRNEELLSHYISFLRAISGKLDKDTISLLVKTQKEEVEAFPLYVEAIKFAFHEESMIRIAVRTLTLNVYHVGDEGVNRYVTSGPLANYFKDFVTFLEKQCAGLNMLVFQASKDPNEEFSSGIIAAVDEIEDNLYYISDVISAGIPDVGRLIADNLLQLLILPLLLPSLTNEAVNEKHIGAITAMYLLCCILRIVKIKDLANTIAAAFFLPREAFVPNSESIQNGDVICPKLHHLFGEGNYDQHMILGSENLKVDLPDDASSPSNYVSSNSALREVLLSYITSGNHAQVLGSLNVLATLLQTKELDETMLDAFGILPQRKQQKKLLLQALVGESSGEEQLFSSEAKESYSSELDYYLQKLKVEFGISLSYLDPRSSTRLHRFQVLDALVTLLCRDISPEALWSGGWLLRQLLPSSEAEFNKRHLKLLRESFTNCSEGILGEIRGVWVDQLITVISDEWRKCKKATEVSTPWKELKYVLLPSQKSHVSDLIPIESSFSAGEKMCNLVKEFVLFYQLLTFFHGRSLPDHAPIHPPVDEPENNRAKAVGLGSVGPKPGTELKLVDAVPCRIAFERGKERHFNFQAMSVGISGWLVLVEELPLKHNLGVVRVVAPLAGCNPRVDDKHPRWLHLRIRPSLLPSMDAAKSASTSKTKSKPLVDGRWTLAFRDEESCQSALLMIHEEISRQSQEVERRLKPLLDVHSTADCANLCSCPEAAAS